MHKKLVFLLFSGVAGPAMAQTVPPQIAAEQVMFEPNNSGYALGQHGNANFKFAQTFQLPRTGMVTHIMLPIYCSTAQAVRVTLQTTLRTGMPSGTVVATQDVPGYAMNSWMTSNGTMSMRMVEFEQPRLLQAGNYAFTIEAIGGECSFLPGPANDTYTGGQVFIINGISLLSWYAWGRDLAFQVFERPR
ncbi:MAG: hypothetical protein JSR63_07015 [Proteobacteria bacterium]|nr:hypothetical protein [Pseudomonadota bacterium]MBS0217921.1 hypothetical protein [Pseudomonadota bacterium]